MWILVGWAGVGAVRVIPQVAIHAFVDTPAPPTYGEYDVVVRISRNAVDVHEAAGGDGPGGWGEKLWGIEGRTYVEYYNAQGEWTRWPEGFDFNGDKRVDLLDFVEFQNAFTGPGQGPT